ncbi:MAG: hypothetical protein ABIQ01_06890 [Pseudolysinimonas sp.]
MSERRPVGWLLGLALIAVAGIGIALVLTWSASEMQIRVNAFWASQTEPVTDEEYGAWDELSTNSYTMLAIVTPLLTAAAAAIFALLAVLAFRWERRRQLTGNWAAEAGASASASASASTSTSGPSIS